MIATFVPDPRQWSLPGRHHGACRSEGRINGQDNKGTFILAVDFGRTHAGCMCKCMEMSTCLGYEFHFFHSEEVCELHLEKITHVSPQHAQIVFCYVKKQQGLGEQGWSWYHNWGALRAPPPPPPCDSQSYTDFSSPWPPSHNPSLPPSPQSENYHIIKEPLSWYNAEVKCESLGGTLASMESAQQSTKLLLEMLLADVPAVWLGSSDLHLDPQREDQRFDGAVHAVEKGLRLKCAKGVIAGRDAKHAPWLLHWVNVSCREEVPIACQGIKSPPPSPPSQPSPPTPEFDGYVIYRIPKTWHAALKHCHGQGGTLAKISSEQQNKQLFSVMLSTSETRTWIGANDIVRERHWKWVDGSEIVYQNWQSGEPNNFLPSEHCAFYQRDGVGVIGVWVDTDCRSEMAFACQGIAPSPPFLPLPPDNPQQLQLLLPPTQLPLHATSPSEPLLPGQHGSRDNPLRLRQGRKETVIMVVGCVAMMVPTFFLLYYCLNGQPALHVLSSIKSLRDACNSYIKAV